MKKRFFLAVLFLFGFFFYTLNLIAADDTPSDRDDELEKALAALRTSVSDPSSAPPSQTSTAVTETAEESTATAPASSLSSEEALSSQAPSQSEPAPTPTAQRANIVSDIEVRGNQIVSSNTILSKIKSRKGAPVSEEVVNEDIKRLYATGFFEDIKMEVEEVVDGYRVVVAVIEKPVVKEIKIEGVTVLKEEKVRKEIKVVEGQVLDRQLVKQGVESIRKMYGDKGYRFADIQSDVQVNPLTKEATVTIRVVEDQKYRIASVKFEGVKAFKTKKLIKLMRTHKKEWFFRSGVFNNAYFQKDLERIQLYYQQEGYLDVKVDPTFDYDKDNRKILITIAVDEGPHYQAGDIRIMGTRIFPESEIWQELQMLPGQTYSQYYLSQDIEKIRQYYHARGYMDARIVPDVRLNKETQKVDVIYEIQEGDLYFVEKVVVRGNTKTKDKVIRRELRVRPGDRFDGEKIQKSKQRLENLGYFEEITYDTEPSPSTPNRKDLIFRVKEKRTGELSFGGGVSSVDRFVGFAEISQKNFDLMNWPRFTGGGQSLSLRGRFGTISQDYNLSFVEPYLFNKPISLGTDLFNIRRSDKNVDFDEERRGFTVTLSRMIKDVFKVGSGYTLERVSVDDLSEDAPLTVQNVAGNNWLSRWSAFTSYDSRDNVFNPTKGMLVSLNGELVGSFLGGDQDFYILQTTASKYWTIFKNHIIEFKGRLGTSQDFGDSSEVPVFDRFFAGGLGTIRGYNYRRVGPIEAGDAVGGQTINIWNLEYTFPIPYLEAFKGAFFVDAGHINSESYKISFGDYAISIGPGLKIKTPIGPVAFYYGFPIANRDTEDRNGRFEFSLSRGF